MASEGSAAPDWLDEAVITGNLDEDFNELVKASELLGSGSEWGSESAVSSVGEEKKIRNRKRGKRGKGKPNGRVGNPVEEEEEVPSEMRPRTSKSKKLLNVIFSGTFGDWPIPQTLPLGGLYNMEDTQLPASWQVPSLAPGTQWLNQPTTSQGEQPSLWPQPSTSTGDNGSNLWADPLNPASLGLSLGPTFGSIFSGTFFILCQNTVKMRRRT